MLFGDRALGIEIAGADGRADDAVEPLLGPMDLRRAGLAAPVSGRRGHLTGPMKRILLAVDRGRPPGRRLA